MISIPYMGKVEFLPPHYMVDIQFQFPIMCKVGSKSPFNDLFKQLFQFPIMGKVDFAGKVSYAWPFLLVSIPYYG